MSFISFALAALGIFVPIIWDKYKSNSSIDIRLVSSLLIVGDNPKLDKLQFSYDGHPVTQLTKFAFVLTNTGRVAIRKDEVVSPIVIQFGNANIIDARIDAVVPDNLESHIKVASSGHEVSIEYPLLNPNDQIQFSILTESREVAIKVSARIAGVRSIIYADQRGKTKSMKRKTISWTVWVVGVFTLLSLGLTLAGFSGAGEEMAIKRLLSSDLLHVPTGFKPQEYSEMIQRALPEFKKTDLKQVTTFLEKLPQSNVLGEDKVKALRALIRETVPDLDMVVAAVVFLGLSIIGIVYVAFALY